MILSTLRAVLGSIYARATGASGAHHEVVDADMTLRQGLDQDCAITQTLACDLALQQVVGEDVER